MFLVIRNFVDLISYQIHVLNLNRSVIYRAFYLMNQSPVTFEHNGLDCDEGQRNNLILIARHL